VRRRCRHYRQKRRFGHPCLTRVSKQPDGLFRDEHVDRLKGRLRDHLDDDLGALGHALHAAPVLAAYSCGAISASPDTSSPIDPNGLAPGQPTRSVCHDDGPQPVDLRKWPSFRPSLSRVRSERTR
jgi:hypothetical protein